MANYTNATPRILWGAGFANSLVFYGKLDRANTMPRYAVETVALVGVDGGAAGESYEARSCLIGTVRRIPRVTAGGVSGWEGADGWVAALAWMRDANPFRWVYDQTALGAYRLAYLVEPRRGPYGEEVNRFKSIEGLVIRSADNLAWEGY